MRFESILSELKRRHVFRVGVAYALIGWAILQVSDLVFPRLGLPDWTVTLVIVLTLLGFPIALLLGWAYDLTPDGVRRTEPAAPGDRTIPAKRRHGVAMAGIGVLFALVGLGGYAFLRLHAGSGGLRSIAVLPFVDMSPGHDQAYFSDGLADELLNELSALPGVQVAARTSAFQFRGKAADLREVGSRLGVEGVVEGSVQRLGDRIRITIQLIDARSGYHVWSGKYDRDARDLFAVQDEISAAVADALRVQLAGADRGRGRTRDLRAYDLYLKGRFFWNKRTPADLQLAIGYFQQALERDPAFALAYSGLAEAYVTPAAPLPLATAVPLGKAAAERALALDPELVPAHTALGTALLSLFDLPGAEREFRRALELDPRYATAHQWYSELLALQGRLTDAFAEVRLAEQLDPLSMIVGWQVGWTLLFQRRYDEALAQFRKVEQLYPDVGRIRFGVIEALLRLGRNDEALAELQHIPGITAEQLKLAAAALEAGGPGALRSLQLRLGHRAGPAKDDPLYPAYASELAYASAGAGDADVAMSQLDWLRSTSNLEPWMVLSMRYDATFDPIRADPRFQHMLRELGADHAVS